MGFVLMAVGCGQVYNIYTDVMDVRSVVEFLRAGLFSVLCKSMFSVI